MYQVRVVQFQPIDRHRLIVSQILQGCHHLQSIVDPCLLTRPEAAERCVCRTSLYPLLRTIMKILSASTVFAVLLLQAQCALAFVPATLRNSNSLSTVRLAGKGGSSAELGLPCEDECALESFPNLPPSVHPGVLSGQAQVDLLKHAKENGECILITKSTKETHVWIVGETGARGGSCNFPSVFTRGIARRDGTW